MGKINVTTERMAELLAMVASLPPVETLPTRQEIARDYQPKGNYLTDHQSLANYATVTALGAVSQALAQLKALHEALTARFEALLGDEGNVSAVIDSYHEMEAFLSGVTNRQTLTGMLSDLRAEIVALIPTGRAAQSDLDALSARVASLESNATSQGEAVTTLRTEVEKRPALPSAPVTNTVYAIKNGSYVSLCDPDEQLLAVKRSS